MGMLWDVLLAGICVCGLALVGWWLFGLLLRPLPGRGAKVVLPGRGDGEALEQQVRSFLWLRGMGLLRWNVGAHTVRPPLPCTAITYAERRRRPCRIKSWR